MAGVRMLAAAVAVVLAVAGCGPRTVGESPGPAGTASSGATPAAGTTGGTPAVVAAPPAATVRLPDLRVGQTIELQVAKAPGWSEPRSTNPAVVAVTDRSDAGTWQLTLRPVGPGSASVLSQLDPCAGVADTRTCAPARSAKAVVYVDVTVAG